MLLATDGCRSPQALEQLIVSAGDTAAADKVKDKPSVRNSSPASFTGLWAAKCTQIYAAFKLLLYAIPEESMCVLWVVARAIVCHNEWLL